MMVPFRPDLGIARIPWVSAGIFVLCFFVHLAQQFSNEEVGEALYRYCSYPTDLSSPRHPVDPFVGNTMLCMQMLGQVHSWPGGESFFDRLETFKGDELTRDEESQVAVMRKHYLAFAADAPPSLDAKLVSDTEFFNPVRALTATFAHADWWHFGGNMIFYAAFGTAIEVLIASSWRYILSILAIAFASEIGFFLVGWLNSNIMPSLGFSGVVSGMIGMGAYMMPMARIRTLVWFIVFLRVISIPAWILALWYVGWDFYDLLRQGQDLGVALSAHVSGAVAGFGFGWLWFRGRKEEYREELEEEIENRRAMRSDVLGVGSSSRAGLKRLAREEEQRRQQQEMDNWLDEVFARANGGQQSDAIVRFIEGLDKYAADLLEVWAQVATWPATRTRLAIARMVVEELFHGQRPREALQVCEGQLREAPDFVLADPHTLMPLVRAAEELQMYELAWALLRNCHKRYAPGAINAYECYLHAARLLLVHMNREADARKIIAGLKKTPKGSADTRLEALARLLEA